MSAPETLRIETDEIAALRLGASLGIALLRQDPDSEPLEALQAGIDAVILTNADRLGDNCEILVEHSCVALKAIRDLSRAAEGEVEAQDILTLLARSSGVLAALLHTELPGRRMCRESMPVLEESMGIGAQYVIDSETLSAYLTSGEVPSVDTRTQSIWDITLSFASVSGVVGQYE